LEALDEATEETIELQQDTFSDVLRTHKKIQANHAYEVLSLAKGHAIVRMQTKQTEKIDDTSYVYEASLFSCANFCAVASVNEPDTHLISAHVEFLNPIKESDGEIVFEAVATTNSSGKKQINVVGTVDGVVVFESSFVTLKLDDKSLLKIENQN
jgi:acyl-coenzyme A thioesterase PaaI-like protein